MSPLRISLHVVFYRDGADWMAHGLEFDLIGDGPTREAALSQLTEAIELQVQASLENKNLKNLFTPADGKYFAMFAAGQVVDVGQFHLQIASIEISEVETRQYLGADVDADLASV